METTKRLTILIIVAVLVACPIQAAEQSSKRISNTRIASCLVKVSCDPVILPLSFETIDYLLHSTGVGGEATRTILGVSQNEVQELFTIEYLHELSSQTPPKSPTRSGMNEYEEAMMMEAERGMDYHAQVGSSSTRSSRGRSSSSQSRKTRPSPRTVMRSNSPAGEKTFLFSLQVELPDEELKPAAEEFMDALVFNLRNALISTFDEHKQKLKKQGDLADEEADRVENTLGHQQEILREISGSRILDRDLILGEISDIRNDIQKIEMEQASDQVVVDITTKQIVEIQAKMRKEIDNDAVTRELRDLLSLQQRNYQNVEKLFKNGSASASDLAEAQQKLARARIEIAQRQDQLSESAGGKNIESLNSGLANYSLSFTQNKIKLDHLTRQLDEAEGLLRKADEYELLSLKIDIAKQNLQETILWRDRMNRQIRMIQPPLVSVIGGN